MGDKPKLYDTRVTVEVWNKIACRSRVIQKYSSLDLLRGGILIWRENNLTRSSFR